MFLFRRRKESTENKKEPADLSKSVNPQGSEKTEKPVENSDTATSENASPVTVIPASALKEESPAESVPLKESEPAKEPVPEEIADALLVKVNRNEPEKGINIPSLNLAPSQPPKAAVPVNTPPVKTPDPKPEPPKKVTESEGKENLFSNLFGQTVEEEETPLDRLVKSLPDITMDEVLNEAEDVKGLMSEWFQSQPK